MLEIDIRKVEIGQENSVRSHHVNLDHEVDLFILLSVQDEKLEELLFHKIVDACIDRINAKNVYKDFSLALENVNAFLDTWSAQKDLKKGMQVVVAVLDKKNLYFSTVGKASCYLYNTMGDIIEITDKKDNFHDFNYISSGEVAEGESIVFSTLRLLDVLSADDMKDGFKTGFLKRSGENIEHILYYEKVEQNIALLSFRKNLEHEVQYSKWGEKIQYYFFRIFDNNFFKNILSHVYYLRDIILQKSKETRQYIFAAGIFLSACILYVVISSFFHVTSNTQNTQEASSNMTLAQNELQKASESLKDPDVFYTHISQAKSYLALVKEKNLFIADVQKMSEDISLLEKQSNGVEMYEANSQNVIFNFPKDTTTVKLVSVNKKIYAIHQKSISGPIIQNEEVQEFSFSDLSEGDNFIDAVEFEGDIILLTQLGRVVRFGKNNFFSYVNVLGQEKWIASPFVGSYAQNLYMLSENKNQILRYKKQGNDFESGTEYLTAEDAQSNGKILSLGIDGGIYTLNERGEILKIFKSPKYRVEKIKLLKLPKNYLFEGVSFEENPSLQVRADLEYVYMLYRDKIFIFKPNTPLYQSVSALTYLGQIEGQSYPIQDFYVDDDGKIIIADSKKISKIDFEVLEGDLILR